MLHFLVSLAYIDCSNEGQWSDGDAVVGGNSIHGLYTANVEKSIRVLEIRGMVEKNGNQDLLASEMLKKFPTKKYTLGGVSIQIQKT